MINSSLANRASDENPNELEIIDSLLANMSYSGSESSDDEASKKKKRLKKKQKKEKKKQKKLKKKLKKEKKRSRKEEASSSEEVVSVLELYVVVPNKQAAQTMVSNQVEQINHPQLV